jgi:3-hydroxyisobutyrate dehydrogenase-like beta-hydroxyacid dehydrogenase
MSANNDTPVSVLGMGEMGRALAGALVDAGYPVTVWIRSPGRTGTLAERGAAVAPTVAEAVAAGRLVVVCLFDQASVHEVPPAVPPSAPSRRAGPVAGAAGDVGWVSGRRRPR